MTDLQRQRIWGEAMLTVAKEIAADLPNVSPQQRRIDAERITALTSVANTLLKGRGPAPLPGMAPPPRPV